MFHIQYNVVQKSTSLKLELVLWIILDCCCYRLLRCYEGDVAPRHWHSWPCPVSSGGRHCIISPLSAPSRLTTLVSVKERVSLLVSVRNQFTIRADCSRSTHGIVTTFFVTNSWCQMPAVCPVLTRDGGSGRADTSHNVTAAQSTSVTVTRHNTHEAHNMNVLLEAINILHPEK